MCLRQDANCSNPEADLFDGVPLPALTSDEFDIQKDDVPGWNDNLTDSLRLSGSLKHVLERITIKGGEGSPEYYVDNTSMLFSDGLATSSPGGIQTSLDIGLLSLAASKPNGSLPYRGSSIKQYTPLGNLDEAERPVVLPS